MIVMGKMGEKMIASVFTDISIIMEQNEPIKSIIFTKNYYLLSRVYAFTFNIFVTLRQIDLGRPDAIP